MDGLNPRVCSVCGAAASEVRQLLKCALCDELRLTPTYYCSAECQKRDWPVHGALHKRQKEAATLWAEGTRAHAGALAAAAWLSATAERGGGEYDVLLLPQFLQGESPRAIQHQTPIATAMIIAIPIPMMIPSQPDSSSSTSTSESVKNIG